MLLSIIILTDTNTTPSTTNIPVTTNSCYESVVPVTPNTCYEIIQITEGQHSTLTDTKRTTNNNNNTVYMNIIQQ